MTDDRLEWRPPLEPGTPHPRPEEGPRHGRLAFRPAPPASPATRTGLLPLGGTDDGGAGLAYVPAPLDGAPLRLVLLLHGAGGSARQGLELMLPVADAYRLLLVAPSSELATWDVITGGYGPDVRRIDRLLAEVAGAYPVGPLTVGGFSDGASYALSLGIANGDLFDSVVAFSPGFAAPMVHHGRPRLWVAHGTADRVLPIDRCSRQLVPGFAGSGYPVTFVEFDGGHDVPAPLVEQAARWLRDGA